MTQKSQQRHGDVDVHGREGMVHRDEWGERREVTIGQKGKGEEMAPQKLPLWAEFNLEFKVRHFRMPLTTQP